MAGPCPNEWSLLTSCPIGNSPNIRDPHSMTVRKGLRSVISNPETTLGLPGSLFKIHMPSLHSRPTEAEYPRMGPRQVCSEKAPGVTPMLYVAKNRCLTYMGVRIAQPTDYGLQS